jgi:hypothetical protein
MLKKTKDQYHRYLDVRQYLLSNGYYLLSNNETQNDKMISKYEVWMNGLSNQYCIEAYRDGYCAIYKETHSIK